jgi:hypothetical protein
VVYILNDLHSFTWFASPSSIHSPNHILEGPVKYLNSVYKHFINEDQKMWPLG